MSEPPALSLSSDVTIVEVQELKQTLLTTLAANHAVVLDLAHAGHIDASGLQTILIAHRSGKLTLRGLSPAIIEDCRRLGWNLTDKGIL